MATVFDVAAHILEQRGSMTAMKLQKLCYYSQAWHLVWDEKPLFDSQIEAWSNGPVIPDLYRQHRGRFRVSSPEEIGGNADALTAEEKRTIDSVLEFYGDKTAHWLSELTHQEAPWRDARTREGLADQERGTAEITHEAMYEYYDGLTAGSTG